MKSLRREQLGAPRATDTVHRIAMSSTCTCVLATPARAMGLATFHTALCQQHCPTVGAPDTVKPTGLFFARTSEQKASLSAPLASLSSALFAKRLAVA